MFNKVTVYLLLVSIFCPKSWAGDRPDIQVGCPKDPLTGERYHEPWCEPNGALPGHGSNSGDNPGGGEHDNKGDFIGHDHPQKYSKFLDKDQNLIPNVYENDYVKNQMARFDAFGNPLKPVTQDEIEEYRKQIGNKPGLGYATMGEVEKSLTAFNDWLYAKRETEKRKVDRAIIFEEQRKWKEENATNWNKEWKAIQEERLAEIKAPIATIQASVIEVSNQAKAKLTLSQVTTQLDQETKEYLLSQLDESNALVETARAGTGEGLSIESAKLIADFALDIVNSIDSFLGGLTVGTAVGIYNAALNVTQVAETIWKHPSILANLSNNMMQTFTSAKYLSDLKLTLTHYAELMTSGSAYDRGYVLGDLSTILLFGIGNLERDIAGKAALEEVASKVISSETAEELTSSFMSHAKSSGLLTEKIETLEQVVKHRGQIRQFIAQTVSQLQKSIRSFDRNVEHHIKWIENPSLKYGEKWDLMTQQHRDNAIHHWKEDIVRAQELKKLAEEILKNKQQ